MDLFGTADAKHKVEEVINEISAGLGSGGGSGRGKSSLVGEAGDPRGLEDIKWTINIPSHMVSRLIGKKGSKIKQLEEQSGAKIQVSSYTNLYIPSSIPLE